MQTEQKKKNPRPTGQYGFGELEKKKSAGAGSLLVGSANGQKNEANNNSEKVNKKR